MRLIPDEIWELWNRGGPFIGPDRSHGRVTVQTTDATGDDSWTLNLARSVARTSPRYPFRWYQDHLNEQVETEVPQVMSIEKNAGLETDAGECTITIWNTEMDPNASGQNRILGDPGHFTPRRHGTKSARARWGVLSEEWEGVLAENALLRTYQGYGGHGLSIAAAIAAGNLVLTGVWLVDDVSTSTDGHLQLKCRDMGKLLIEQPLVPPLVAAGRYPLVYKRWNGTKDIRYNPVSGYDKTDVIAESPVPAEGHKFFTDVTLDMKSRGYLAVGTDGGVFTRGTSFYGSRGAGSAADGGPMMGIAYAPQGAGYWTVITDGTVHAFGTARDHGDASAEVFDGHVIRIRATASGRGYWLLTSRGKVFSYGDAAVLADFPESTGPISDPGFPLPTEYVDFHPTPSGLGLWGLNDGGEVFVVGDAELHLRNGTVVGNTDISETAAGIVPTRTGEGYWILAYAGRIYRFGDATELTIQASKLHPSPTAYVAQGGGVGIAGDPMVAIARTRSGRGLITITGNGRMWFYGDAVNFGSFNEFFQATVKLDGNYTDYTDIVQDFLLWSGFQFGDGPGRDEEVYGLLESTGAWSEEQIDPDLFDKKPVIDGIGAIKEIVGYHFWIDDEGAARFVSPNWYRVGNLMADGTWTGFIPEIDERIHLTSYQATGSDRSARSEIMISSSDPIAGFTNTITTRLVLDDERLHGMIRPASWFNGHFTKKSEQEAMAELIAHHIEMTKRAGTVTCIANPAFEINDQVRIWERNSRETGVHWVRSITTTHDLMTGRYMMTMQVNALPDLLPLRPALRAPTPEEIEDAEWAEEERVLRA